MRSSPSKDINELAQTCRPSAPGSLERLFKALPCNGSRRRASRAAMAAPSFLFAGVDDDLRELDQELRELGGGTARLERAELYSFVRKRSKDEQETLWIKNESIALRDISLPRSYPEADSLSIFPVSGATVSNSNFATTETGNDLIEKISSCILDGFNTCLLGIGGMSADKTSSLFGDSGSRTSQISQETIVNCILQSIFHHSRIHNEEYSSRVTLSAWALQAHEIVDCLAPVARCAEPLDFTNVLCESLDEALALLSDARTRISDPSIAHFFLRVMHHKQPRGAQPGTVGSLAVLYVIDTADVMACNVSPHYKSLPEREKLDARTRQVEMVHLFKMLAEMRAVSSRAPEGSSPAAGASPDAHSQLKQIVTARSSKLTTLAAPILQGNMKIIVAAFIRDGDACYAEAKNILTHLRRVSDITTACYAQGNVNWSDIRHILPSQVLAPPDQYVPDVRQRQSLDSPSLTPPARRPLSLEVDRPSDRSALPLPSPAHSDYGDINLEAIATGAFDHNRPSPATARKVFFSDAAPCRRISSSTLVPASAFDKGPSRILSPRVPVIVSETSLSSRLPLDDLSALAVSLEGDAWSRAKPRTLSANVAAAESSAPTTADGSGRTVDSIMNEFHQLVGQLHRQHQDGIAVDTVEAPLSTKRPRDDHPSPYGALPLHLSHHFAQADLTQHSGARSAFAAAPIRVDSPVKYAADDKQRDHAQRISFDSSQLLDAMHEQRSSGAAWGDEELAADQVQFRDSAEVVPLSQVKTTYSEIHNSRSSRQPLVSSLVDEGRHENDWGGGFNIGAITAQPQDNSTGHPDEVEDGSDKDSLASDDNQDLWQDEQASEVDSVDSLHRPVPPPPPTSPPLLSQSSPKLRGVSSQGWMPSFVSKTFPDSTLTYGLQETCIPSDIKDFPTALLEIEQLRKRQEALLYSIRTEAQERDYLAQRCNAMQEDMAELRAQCEVEIDSSKYEVRQLQSKLRMALQEHSMEDVFSAVEHDLNRLTKENEHLRNANLQLESRLLDQTTQIHEKSTYEEQASQYNNNVQRLTERLKRSGQEREAIKSAYEQLKARDRRHTVQEKLYKDATHRLKLTFHELQKCKKQMEAEQLQHMELSRQFQALQTFSHELKESNVILIAENEQLTREAQALKNRLRDVEQSQERMAKLHKFVDKHVTPPHGARPRTAATVRTRASGSENLGNVSMAINRAEKVDFSPNAGIRQAGGSFTRGYAANQRPERPADPNELKGLSTLAKDINDFNYSINEILSPASTEQQSPDIERILFTLQSTMVNTNPSLLPLVRRLEHEIHSERVKSLDQRSKLIGKINVVNGAKKV